MALQMLISTIWSRFQVPGVAANESLGFKGTIPLMRNLTMVFSIMKPIFDFRCHVTAASTQHMVPTLTNVTFKGPFSGRHQNKGLFRGYLC